MARLRQVPIHLATPRRARRTARAGLDWPLGELVGWADGRLSVPPPGPTYPSYDSGYHDPGELVTYIRSAEIAFPDLVQIVSIGKSYQGRDIWAAKVSDNVATDEDEPEVLVDALHHAREHFTVEQALYLLKALVNGYGTDGTVTRLVTTREVWIVFAVNPDGWAWDLGGSPYRGWRKNVQPTPGSTAVGTDPNRNYAYHWGCCGGSSSDPAAWNYRGPAAWSAGVDGHARLRAEPGHRRPAADQDARHAAHER